MKKSKILALILCLLVLIGLLAGCGMDASSADRTSKSAAASEQYGTDNSAPEPGEASSNGIVLTTDRMIVYTVEMGITVEDIDASVKQIRADLAKVGGYEAQSNLDKDTASLRLRVPTENLNALLDSLEGIGEVVDRDLSSDDITDRYTSAVAERDALVARKKALEALLDQAKTLSEVMDLTDRIYDVSQQIDAYSHQITDFKKQADYSTVNLTLYTVAPEPKPVGFWAQMGSAFKTGWRGARALLKGLAVGLAAIAPFIGLTAAGFILYVFIKWIVCLCARKPLKLFGKPLRKK